MRDKNTVDLFGQASQELVDSLICFWSDLTSPIYIFQAVLVFRSTTEDCLWCIQQFYWPCTKGWVQKIVFMCFIAYYSYIAYSLRKSTSHTTFRGGTTVFTASRFTERSRNSLRTRRKVDLIKLVNALGSISAALLCLVEFGGGARAPFLNSGW